MPASREELNKVKEGIELLRQLDGRYSLWRKRWRVFGARRHQYRLNPTLSEAYLLEFEKRHGITLPSDYRSFLLHIGDGDVGPSYGLIPLEKAARGGDLRQPFPLTRSSDQYSDAELEELGFDNDLNGVLQLCHHGCGMYSYLVANGSEHGTMWYDNGDFHSAQMRFIDWYTDWIDKQLHFLKIQK